MRSIFIRNALLVYTISNCVLALRMDEPRNRGQSETSRQIKASHQRRPFGVLSQLVSDPPETVPNKRPTALTLASAVKQSGKENQISNVADISLRKSVLKKLAYRRLAEMEELERTRLLAAGWAEQESRSQPGQKRYYDPRKLREGAFTLSIATAVQREHEIYKLRDYGWVASGSEGRVMYYKDRNIPGYPGKVIKADFETAVEHEEVLNSVDEIRPRLETAGWTAADASGLIYRSPDTDTGEEYPLYVAKQIEDVHEEYLKSLPEGSESFDIFYGIRRRLLGTSWEEVFDDADRLWYREKGGDQMKLFDFFEMWHKHKSLFDSFLGRTV